MRCLSWDPPEMPNNPSHVLPCSFALIVCRENWVFVFAPFATPTRWSSREIRWPSLASAAVPHIPGRLLLPEHTSSSEDRIGQGQNRTQSPPRCVLLNVSKGRLQEKQKKIERLVARFCVAFFWEISYANWTSARQWPYVDRLLLLLLHLPLSSTFDNYQYR